MTRYRCDSGATRAWKIHELHMSKVRHQRRLGPRREENYGGLVNSSMNPLLLICPILHLQSSIFFRTRPFGQKPFPVRPLPVAAYGHYDQWVSLLVWGFLLVFYCNHSHKMHRSELRAWDRQSDRRADRSIAECPTGRAHYKLDGNDHGCNRAQARALWTRINGTAACLLNKPAPANSVSRLLGVAYGILVNCWRGELNARRPA